MKNYFNEYKKVLYEEKKDKISALEKLEEKYILRLHCQKTKKRIQNMKKRSVLIITV